MADRDADREREDALLEVKWRAGSLAANMMRVIAGAGKPFDLAQQSHSLGKAIVDLPPGVRVGDVNDAILEALSQGLEKSPGLEEFGHAVRELQRDALRIVAARVLGQDVQVTRRENDFFHSIGYLDRVRKANREKHEREAAERRPAAPIARKPRKPKPAMAPPPSTRPKAKPVASSSEFEEDIDPSAWKTTADYMRLRQAQLRRKQGLE